jgi:hypothetical protein
MFEANNPIQSRRRVSAGFQCLAIALSAALIAPIFAQSQALPDISGKWVLNIAKSKLAKGAKTGSEMLVITSSASNVTMRFNVDGKESIQAYATDGKEHVAAEFQGGQNLVKAYWKKIEFNHRDVRAVKNARYA